MSFDYKPPEGLIVGQLNLIQQDGNAMFIIGAVRRALKDAGNSKEIIQQVSDEMMSGDYEHLLYVANSVVEPD